MGDDDRQRVGVLRLHVNEMDVQAVNVGDEVGVGIELGFGPAPVMLVLPIIQQLLHGGQIYALAGVVHGLAFRQPGLAQAQAQIGQRRFREADPEWPDQSAGRSGCQRGGEEADHTRRSRGGEQGAAGRGSD